MTNGKSAWVIVPIADPPANAADSVVAGVAEVVERGRKVAPASPAVDRLTGGTITSLAGRSAVVIDKDMHLGSLESSEQGHDL